MAAMSNGFRKILRGTIPDGWKTELTRAQKFDLAAKLCCAEDEVGDHACISAPQCDISVRYVQWSSTQDSREVVPIMLHDIDNWKRSHGGEAGFAVWVSDFARLGHPQLIWERAFYKKNVEEQQHADATRTEFENTGDAANPSVQ